MDDKYYLDQINRIQELNEKYLDGMSEILRTFLALQSTLIALISALLPTMSLPKIHLGLLIVALVLLLMGCLLSLIALYDLRDLPRRAKEVFLTEVLDALKENRAIKNVPIERKKRTRVVAIFSAAFFFLALATLIAYATMFLYAS